MRHFSRFWSEAEIESFPSPLLGLAEHAAPCSRAIGGTRCASAASIFFAVEVGDPAADAELIESLARALPEPCSCVVLGDIVFVE